MLCVSVAEKGFQRISDLIKNTEMAEIRLESSGLSYDEVKQLFQSHPNLLATCRPDGISESERMEYLKTAIDSGAKWVDIEIESEDTFINTMVEYAKSKGCRVVISHHNYEKTPDIEPLSKIIIDAVKYAPSLIKIATKVSTIHDTGRLLALYQYKVPMLAIGMGPLGKITRVAAMELGAPFTFVRADDSLQTAPGQLSQNSMTAIINELKSE